MMTRELQNSEISWRGLLNCPEASVLSSMEERELLLELAECRRRIVQGMAESADSHAAPTSIETDFQQVVRELAGREGASSAVRSAAARYQEIRGKLALANVRLVAHVAKKYCNRGVSPADLAQEGFCGLLLAIDRFDVSNETRLATYAIWWIRQAIQRAVAAGAYPVRLNPKQLHQLARGHEEADTTDWSAPRSAAGDHAPSGSAIDRLVAATRPTVSLDAPMGRDGTNALIDFLVNPPDEDASVHEVSEDVGAMIKLLNPREQMVVKLRFGLDGERKCSLIEVGHIMGVSKERIRQIQERALEKLREGAGGRQVSRAG